MHGASKIEYSSEELKILFFLGRHQLPTVWKFHDFSITQILREINFVDSRSAKSAILTHLEAQNFDFYEFFAIVEG